MISRVISYFAAMLGGLHGQLHMSIGKEAEYLVEPFCFGVMKERWRSFYIVFVDLVLGFFSSLVPGWTVLSTAKGGADIVRSLFGGRRHHYNPFVSVLPVHPWS